MSGLPERLAHLFAAGTSAPRPPSSPRRCTNNGWARSCLPRPWEFPLGEVEQRSKLDDAAKHALPAITIPETVVAGPVGDEQRPVVEHVHEARAVAAWCHVGAAAARCAQTEKRRPADELTHVRIERRK